MESEKKEAEKENNINDISHVTITDNMDDSYINQFESPNPKQTNTLFNQKTKRN